MKKLDLSFENYKKSTARLSEACRLYDEDNDIVRDSIIQRFEFTFTVAITVLKAYMESQGVHFDNDFPRLVLKEAYRNKLIKNEKAWLSIIEDRNATSHMYNEQLADEIAQRITSVYIFEFQRLCDRKEDLM